MAAALLRGPFARVTLANFFFFLNFASFFLLPLYVRALGGSEGTVGAVMGTQGIAALLALPAVGMALDRFGRRRFFAMGTVGMTLAALAYTRVDSLGVGLYLLRALQGVSFAAAFTASTTLAAELAPRGQRAQALGLFGVSTLLTHAFAPIVGEELIRRAGFPALFTVAAGFSTVPLFLLLGVPALPRPAGGQPEGTFRLSRAQAILVVSTTFVAVGFGTVITFVPTFVRNAALGRVGAFFAAYTAAAISTRLVGARLSDSLGRRRVLLPSLLLLSASIAGLSLIRNLPALVLVGALFGLAQGMTYPTLHAFLVDLTPAAQLGRSQAVFNGSFNLGVLSSAFVFGQVADAVGQRPMFALASLMPLVATAILFACDPALPRGTAKSTVPPALE